MGNNNIFRNIFKLRRFGGSLKLAIKGIAYLFLYHRNMRLIFLIGIAVFLLGLHFKLKGIELVALCITITVVFIAEIFNTAIEMMMNVLTDKYHPKVKLIKDIAAAVVVLTCLNAIAVGFVLFGRRIFKF